MARTGRLHRRGAAAAVAVLLAACATNPANLASRDAKDIISSDEIVSRPFVTAYDAVRTLRPWWLAQVSGSMGGPAVYREDEPLRGGFLALRSILIETVHELRFYETDHAVAKWGEVVARRSGVIEIVSRD
jgi:hypothetical protein